ncbi:Cys/Met metabolism PLP-dependent enzyme-domain-containing protein [Schizophyllum amplum]|uniref:Cys/Met metabolism PLP-dependent enzyme-domain-containing protein n=1 Tax=Schizophyllum amplum TaxID=97359 RepID=A0A550CTC8_9AGAR|nr:Cys/Met metabolism PLP-dependent enzyme-domain-containing protein [Auriculariopsis ampla]
MAPPKVNGTDLIHGDGVLGHTPEVAPSISMSTTFRAPLPDPDAGPIDLSNVDLRNPTRDIYSRYTQPVSTRVEHILSKVNNGFALTYASGLAAFYSALVHVRPKRVAVQGGYHGCHVALQVYNRARDVVVPSIGLDDEYEPGDMCWLETPLNPTGEARDIQHYADKVHKVGGVLLVDATFGPPPLQYPFNFGADIIMHSGTKYFGGHSDLLCGVLIVKTHEKWTKLWTDRTYMGNMMGSLEAWLLLRSLRTLHLRVPRQSENAAQLAQWLSQIAHTPVGQKYDGVPGGIIARVWHSSLQGIDARGFDPKRQMAGGWNATFAMEMANSEYARLLPHALKYYIAATSLGGVETLIEQRIQSDPGAPPGLIRISVGVEDIEDLKADMKQALLRLKGDAKL